MNETIQFQSVCKSFGKQQVLKDVSFSVPPGTVFAILGENGAGKSTTIKSMLGFISPDRGSIKVLKQDPVRDAIAIRERIGYVAERPQLYDWMTVAEIGWYAAGFYNDSYAPRFQSYLEQFQLPPKQKIRNLSKGTKAKLALTLALSHDPELLILDEPTSGLDTLVRREFLESMVDRAAAGKTVFISSHQISEVERIADWVAILHQGELLLVERLEKLKAETTEIVINLAEPNRNIPTLKDEIYRQRRLAKQWRILARNASELELNELRTIPYVTEVDVRTPSLEEIFVAMLTRKQSLDSHPSETATTSSTV